MNPSSFRPTLVLLIVMTALCGFIYPASVWLVAQTFFPDKANGSFITRDGQKVGSKLLGQSFHQDVYFWPRPSALDTAKDKNAYIISPASNLGPGNPALITRIEERKNKLAPTLQGSNQPLPVDFLLASGSGLDPDISPEAAFLQASRVANARHVPIVLIQRLIQDQIQDKELYFLGERRVNVLQLNLALDAQLGAGK
ncbi:MAG: potassium-transporting ATPase subunit KdpC [Proteobacteria bacterium]|jgi:K+-transporting ATPase ATPase C chain|nr:potassium-transporting ATPase subunit KdpC [Alphaproteobacteria bacterium]NCC03257.1 potassium-transporting ATPase subunit KdpC [Pseudomonadota bacterium]